MAIYLKSTLVGIAFAVLLTAKGVAATLPSYQGDWALKVGAGRNLIILHLERPAEGKPLTGSLMRPKHFELDTIGNTVSKVSGGTVSEPIIRAVDKVDAVDLVVQNPTDPKDTDEFELSLFDADHGSLKLAGVALPAVRVKPNETVTADWPDKGSYLVNDLRPSNLRMTAIFDADQKDREGKIDWTVVSKADASRRQAVRELLRSGDLHTGADFEHAAFVFQHGDEPNDYLLAHTLAIIAVKKGRTRAIWIAAATLDRYLQRTEKPQIYGTQFMLPGGKQATQEPFDRDLISDALRVELGVPPLRDQDVQRATYDKDAAKAAIK
jgi:hypothetical protein